MRGGETRPRRRLIRRLVWPFRKKTLTSRRRREREDEETSPRRRREREDEEASPRRRREREDEEASPRRRREREDEEAAPRRRRAEEEREDDAQETAGTAPKRKTKNFLLDDDEFEFEFLNMDDKK